MTPFALEQAAKTLLASVIAEGRWLPSLEGLMGEMNVLGGGLARTSPPKMFAIPSSGVRQPFADFQAGMAPTLTRRTPMAPAAETGFVADYMTSTKANRDHDPFHHEFLRPRHCVHQTSALLDTTKDGAVGALIFRTEKQGRFEADELQSLNSVLPYLRSAAMVARGALQGEARKLADPFERRGEPVLHLGPDGRVLEMNPAAEQVYARSFQIVNRRVVTIVPADQPRLDRALKMALSAGKPGLVTLASFSAAGQTMALILPVLGQARDVFEAVSVMVVLLDPDHRPAGDDRSLTLLRDAGGLTGREFDVVRLVAAGIKPREAADHLGIGYGTARLHLKASFAKLGVHSQGELSRLVRRLS